MMVQNNKKTELLFKTLPFLLKDMEEKEWIIDSFSFRYKAKQYIVILTRYKENEKKPSQFAKAKVEFISRNNTNYSISGFIDFYNVWFNNKKDFCDYFGVEIGDAKRDLFKDFSRIFSKFIPREKTLSKSDVEKKLIGSRAEGNNPNAIYCYDVRRNGRNKTGSLNKRSIENSNKAETLRPHLYERFCNDTNLSFFFSDNRGDERSDLDILNMFAER